MLAEARRSANGEHFLDRRAGLKLAANNLDLPINGTESGNDEKRHTVGEGGSLETAPSACSGGNKQMLFTIGANFDYLKVGRLLTL